MEQQLKEITREIIKQYNPCHREGSKCLVGNPVPCCEQEFTKKVCEQKTSTGCSDIPLECSTWLCRTALSQIDPDCLKLLKEIEMIGKHYGFIKRPFLGERYVGSSKF